MENLKQNMIIALTEHVRELFSNNRYKLSWTIQCTQDPDEETGNAEFKILINSAEQFRIPMVINEDEAQRLGRHVVDNIAKHDWTFYVSGEVSFNDGILLSVTPESEGSNKYNVKIINNGFNEGEGEDYAITPYSFDLGSISYHEPNTRYHVIKRTLHRDLAKYFRNEFDISDFSISVTSHFINPNDLKEIEKMSAYLYEAISISSNHLTAISSLVDREVTKLEEDGDKINVKHAHQGLMSISEDLNEVLNTDRLMIKNSRVRSADLKRTLGLTCATYFKAIDDLLTNFDGKVMSYETINYSKQEELQQNHEEAVVVMSNIIGRLTTTVHELADSYQSYL